MFKLWCEWGLTVHMMKHSGRKDIQLKICIQANFKGLAQFTLLPIRELFPGISKTRGKVLICDLFHNSSYQLHFLKNKCLNK